LEFGNIEEMYEEYFRTNGSLSQSISADLLC
jgi:hypothetical protein